MIIEKTEYINDNLLGGLEWLVANERIKGYKLDKVITLNDGTSFTIRTDLWVDPLGTFLR